MLVKIVLAEAQKTKNGQNDELGAQLSQVFFLFPIINIPARKGTVFAIKGKTKANRKGLKALNILRAARYQAKCEAQNGMDQDIPLPHLDR